MKGSVPLGRIRGIQLRFHCTGAATFALVTWSLATTLYPIVYPEWGRATYWVAGSISAFLLFASVLLHELAHSFVAQFFRIPVSGITLSIFGGISHIEDGSQTARQEFAVASAGPLLSLLLGGALWGAYALAPVAAPSPAYATLAYLAVMNLMLGIFNLVPAYPLDGGRIFRAMVWAVTGERFRSIRVAARLGQGLSLLLMALGGYSLTQREFVSGAWTIAVGFFMLTTATMGRADSAVTEAELGSGPSLQPQAPGALVPILIRLDDVRERLAGAASGRNTMHGNDRKAA